MAELRQRCELWIVRHGTTAWSRSGLHTSRSEIPLEPEGEVQARLLGERLDPALFDLALSSPRVRARRTAELAGFTPEVEPRLAEWDYGDYEGVTTAAIREVAPGWTVFTSPLPGGETPDQVAHRADQVISRVRGRVIVFTHGHFGRVLVARWLGLTAADGRFFKLETATVNVLSHEREQAVVERWNA